MSPWSAPSQLAPSNAGWATGRMGTAATPIFPGRGKRLGRLSRPSGTASAQSTLPPSRGGGNADNHIWRPLAAISGPFGVRFPANSWRRGWGESGRSTICSSPGSLLEIVVENRSLLRAAVHGVEAPKLRSIALLVAGVASVWFCGSACGMPLNANTDALMVAIDPAKGPPIAKPVYSKNNSAPELGPPGGYTPERPARMGLMGVAVIRCALASSGRLINCSLVADGPLDCSYGDAALKMAREGYLKATPPEAFHDGDEVRVIVVFPKPPGWFGH
jgi:hypothetical protein